MTRPPPPAERQDGELAGLPAVLLLGPHRAAVSGVSTHLNLLFACGLGQQFRLRHFQVGSEGRNENAAGRLARLLSSPFRLAATVLGQRVDIVHFNTSLNRRAYWRDLAYLLVVRLSGARVIYQIHGGALPQQFSGNNRLLGALLRATLSLPEAIVVLAQCELAAYRGFLRNADVRVVPNAIDCAPYAMLAREASVGQGPLRLLYIGRLAREKGLFEALTGLHLARAQGIDACLLIAGSGPDEAALRQAVDRLQLAQSVTFAGPVFDEAKVRLLGSAHVLLFPTYAEGLPYALLECMAAGIPPITTRVGAIPDVVVDNRHGIFVAPRDAEAIGQAIGRLAANPGQVTRMGAACRQQIESRYSIQRFAKDFARLYSEIGVNRRRSAVARP